MKNEKLSTDEYDALEQVGLGGTHQASACVGRNKKRLSGLKLIGYDRQGRLTVLENGARLLFVRRCILALRAVAQGSATELDDDVALFLAKKSHITPSVRGFDLTNKGRESLADMDAQTT